MSSSVIRLWTCGNRSLQRKIELNVTSVVLSSPNRFTNRRLPSMLSQLTSLRSFSITANEIMLIVPFNVLHTVQSLSPTLTSLRISIVRQPSLLELFLSKEEKEEALYDDLMDDEDFADMEDDDDDEMDAWDDDPQWPLARRIHRRFFLNPLLFDVLQARPNLESLSIPNMSQLTMEELQRLPQGLKSLEIDLLHLKAWSTRRIGGYLAKLPPNLTALSNGYFHHQAGSSNLSLPVSILPYLPKSLTHLGGVMWEELSFDSLPHFPPSLKNLSVKSTHPDESIEQILQKTLTHVSSAQLPPLTDIHAFNPHFIFSPITALPRTLTTLHARMDLSTVNQGDWPPCLTNMKLVFAIDPLDAVARLPTTLRDLQFYYIREDASLPASVVSLLPRRLTSLDMNFGTFEKDDTLDFPPMLRSLELYAVKMAPAVLKRLPQTVTRLKCFRSTFEVAHFEVLPPNLKIFIFSILDLSSFDDTPHTPIPGVFSMLPRTLTDFSFFRFMGRRSPPESDWSQLPPGLTRLALAAPTSPSILSQMSSLVHLTSLVLFVGGNGSITNEHCQSLPRSLNNFVLHKMCWGCDVTTEGLKHLPLELDLGLTQPLQKASTALLNRRIVAFTLEDLSEFKRLSHPDTIVSADFEPYPSFSSPSSRS